MKNSTLRICSAIIKIMITIIITITIMMTTITVIIMTIISRIYRFVYLLLFILILFTNTSTNFYIIFPSIDPMSSFLYMANLYMNIVLSLLWFDSGPHTHMYVMSAFWEPRSSISDICRQHIIYMGNIPRTWATICGTDAIQTLR